MTPNDPSSATRPAGRVDCNSDAMALLGNCHRTIHTVQHPQNKAFLLRKPLPADPASFGERFRAARVACGYTQADMARKFDVSFSTVRFWEQGRTQPMPTMRYQVEAILNEAPFANSDSALPKSRAAKATLCSQSNNPARCAP